MSWWPPLPLLPPVPTTSPFSASHLHFSPSPILHFSPITHNLPPSPPPIHLPPPPQSLACKLLELRLSRRFQLEGIRVHSCSASLDLNTHYSPLANERRVVGLVISMKGEVGSEDGGTRVSKCELHSLRSTPPSSSDLSLALEALATEHAAAIMTNQARDHLTPRTPPIRLSNAIPLTRLSHAPHTPRWRPPRFATPNPDEQGIDALTFCYRHMDQPVLGRLCRELHSKLNQTLTPTVTPILILTQP